MIPGSVSHYRMLGQIGQGGMGVVYKAIDTQLNRPVAIKAIRESLLTDSQAKVRLRREALAAASIDHPFICKVYELLENEGQTLVVMEWVEGETLQQRLKSGPLPVDEAVAVAREVAEALEPIHSNGLVHRDLKPGNIMITPQRHAKLMDFGLVRSEESSSAEGDTRLTAAYALVGTSYYMSPEQAIGEVADSRSDVFSLGVVLFESLTGQLPFQGSDRQSYLRSLLADSPRRVEDLRPDIHPQIAAVVGKCLRKDRKERYESGVALFRALTEAGGKLERQPAAGGFRPKPLLYGSLLFLAVVALAYWALNMGTDPVESPFVVASEIPLVSWPSDEGGARLSPDGQWVSFQSDRGGRLNLWLAPAKGGDPRRLTDETELRVVSHVWSEDGQQIAYLGAVVPRSRLVLKIIPVFGGPPVQVVPLESNWLRLTPALSGWVGDFIYLLLNAELWKWSAGSQQLEKVNDLRFRYLDINADATQLLYSPLGQPLEIWTSEVDGTSPARIGDAQPAQNPRWAGPQRYVFLSSRAGRMDAWISGLEGSGGAPTRVASAIGEISDVSRDGRVLLLSRQDENSNLFCWDGKAAPRQITAEAFSDFWPTRSSDGAFAFQRSRPTQVSQLFDARIFLSTARGCSFSEARLFVEEGYGPRLSSDGQWLAYVSITAPTTRSELWIESLRDQRRRRVGSLMPTPFRSFPFDRLPQVMAWAAGRSRLFHVARSESGLAEIHSLDPVKGEEDIRLLWTGRTRQRVPAIAPNADGSKLAFVTWEPDAPWQIRVLDVASGAERTVYEDREVSELTLPGWLPEGVLTMLRCFDLPQMDGQRVEIALLDATGQRRSIGSIDQAFGSAAVLDAARRLLYITAIRGIAHNAFAFSLADGSLKQLTDNDFQGRTFCGYAVGQDGELWYSQQERNSEVLVVTLENAHAGDS